MKYPKVKSMKKIFPHITNKHSLFDLSYAIGAHRSQKNQEWKGENPSIESQQHCSRLYSWHVCGPCWTSLHWIKNRLTRNLTLSIFIYEMSQVQEILGLNIFLKTIIWIVMRLQKDQSYNHLDCNVYIESNWIINDYFMTWICAFILGGTQR